MQLTLVLAKRQLESCQRQELSKAGAYFVSIDRKTSVYRLEACKTVFFQEPYQAVHSNAFPYLTDLPVSSSSYPLYGSRTVLHNSVWYSASPLYVGVRLAGK